MLNLQNFKEIFSTNIEVGFSFFHFLEGLIFRICKLLQYLVERVTLNFVLLAIPNSFLVNVGTSPAFCSVLLDFLLARLGELGSMHSWNGSKAIAKPFQIRFSKLGTSDALREVVQTRVRLRFILSAGERAHASGIFKCSNMFHVCNWTVCRVDI